MSFRLRWRVSAILVVGLLYILTQEASAQIPTTSAPTVPTYIGLPPASPDVPQPLGSQPTSGPVPAAVTASDVPFAGPSAQTSSGAGVLQYDPAMDNRLKSPQNVEGLFGMKIIEVERNLRNYGARPYSYAFGKYSRMTFSAYLLTLLFDRHRKLGGVVVTPRPPFSLVEAQAQQFLIKLFLQNADLKKFQTVIGKGRLEIWFEDNQKFGKSTVEALDRKEQFLR